VSLRKSFLIGLLSLCSTLGVSFAQSDSLHPSTDPNAFRLFMAPTSVTLPANNGTIQLAELSIPCINYGVIDELIVRGGFTPFTISSHILYYGMAGLEIFNYSGFSGVGGLAITNMTGESRGWEGSLYGFGVIGYTNSKFGVYSGFGGGYSASRESSSAIFMVGGVYDISNHNAIVTENWFISESESDGFSIGLRIWGKVLAGEFGVLAITKPHSWEFQTVAPWVSLSYHFDTSE
jgi:hypothetical protein